MSATVKILPVQELADLLESHRRAGRRIVFTNGAFDLLHVGHVRALEEAATHGGVLVVAVNSDRTVREAKGTGRPVVPEQERAELVAALSCVDYVTVFDSRTVDDLLRLFRPDVHAKGRDYTPDTIPERATSAELGTEIAIVGDAKVHSSTQLLARAAGTQDAVDRVVPLDRPGVRGSVLRDARRILEREGWLDLERLVTTQEGALVHERRHRTVRRIEVAGHALYVKALHPLERRRSPIVEYKNHLALRAAGFRAPEPWACMEGRLGREEAGVLITHEAAGLALDEYLTLALPEIGPRRRTELARGIGSTLRGLYAARFFHPDLQAWHVFVEGSAAGGRRALTFIDLMRLERGGSRVRRRKAAEGLAAMALSLRDQVGDRFLLSILRAYLGGTLHTAGPWLRAIEKHMAKLQHKGTFRAR